MLVLHVSFYEAGPDMAAAGNLPTAFVWPAKQKRDICIALPSAVAA